MAKIKDLGINVIPDTMRPPEIGQGGGCRHTYYAYATDCCPITCHVTTGQYQQQYAQPDFTACCPISCHVTTGAQPTGGQQQYVQTDFTACCPISCRVTTGATGQYMVDCCPGSCHVTTTINPPGSCITRESIAQLREQFQQKLAQLDEAEKQLGPQTAEEIDAREKAIKAELAELAARRKALKGK